MTMALSGPSRQTLHRHSFRVGTGAEISWISMRDMGPVSLRYVDYCASHLSRAFRWRDDVFALSSRQGQKLPIVQSLLLVAPAREWRSWFRHAATLSFSWSFVILES